MIFSKVQIILMPTAFTCLFVLMLLYWGQAVFFAHLKFNKITRLVFYLCILLLTTLLLLRWIDSGHFPSSNLYESLLFLSWSFLFLQLILQSTSGLEKVTSIKELSSNPSELKISVQKTTNIQSKSYPLLNTEPQYLYDKATLAMLPNIATEMYLKPNTAQASVPKNYVHFGVVLSPISFLTFTFAFLSLPKEMQKATALVPALQSNWLMMHVTVMILSYAALLCGSLLAIAFLVLDWYFGTGLKFQTKFEEGSDLLNRDKGIASQNSLTEHRDMILETEHHPIKAQNTFTKHYEYKSYSPQKIDNSLSLCDRLDSYSYRVLALGFPLLTIGILSGAIWANEAWGSYWSWDPKETWALITWLVFAIYLHTRISKGWNGKKSAKVAAFGFFVVWFCYLGVNLLGTGLHSYGWFANSNF